MEVLLDILKRQVKKLGAATAFQLGVYTWQWVRPRTSMPLACWHKRVSSWSWWMSMRCWFSTTMIWRQDTQKCAKPTLIWRTPFLGHEGGFGWQTGCSYYGHADTCEKVERWGEIVEASRCLSDWQLQALQRIRLNLPGEASKEGKDSGKWVWGRWRAAIYTGAAGERDARNTRQAFRRPAAICLGCAPCAS